MQKEIVTQSQLGRAFIETPELGNRSGPLAQQLTYQEGSTFGSTNVTGYNFQGNFYGLTINSTGPLEPQKVDVYPHSGIEPVTKHISRLDLRDEIETKLWDWVADDKVRTLVVWGLGGVGKTQCVRDYARRFRARYKSRFWIEAGGEQLLERDYVNLFRSMYGMYATRSTEVVSLDNAVAGVKNWFSHQEGPWLMVFDGADSIDNEQEPNFIDIRRFIPDVPSLHVIVTSRSSKVRHIANANDIEVDTMHDREAVDLFYEHSELPRGITDVEYEIHAIVDKLGFLALAIALAAAYVRETPRLRSNIKAYLPEYEARRKHLLGRRPEVLLHQYHESVLTTWETSFSAVHGLCPEASRFMTMLAFLSLDDIFLELFANDEATENKKRPKRQNYMDSTIWKYMLSDENDVDTYKIEEYFEALQRFSLVQLKYDQTSYCMHKLVHAWGFERLTAGEKAEFSLASFHLVAEALERNAFMKAPGDDMRLVPHITTNFCILVNIAICPVETALSVLADLEWIGYYLRDIGRYSERRLIQEYVLSERKRLLGQEHAHTIAAMANLANALLDLEEIDTAAEMKKLILDKKREIYGEDDESTLGAMINYAASLKKRDDLPERTEIERDAFQRCRVVLGDDHLTTIKAKHNLASTLMDQGELVQAAQMQFEVINKRREILGDNHPEFFAAMHNYAITLAAQGKWLKAMRVRRDVFDYNKREFGEEHPETVSAMLSLEASAREGERRKAAAKSSKAAVRSDQQPESHHEKRFSINNISRIAGLWM